MISVVYRMRQWLLQLASPGRAQQALEAQARVTGSAMHLGQQSDLMVEKDRRHHLFRAATMPGGRAFVLTAQMAAPPRDSDRQGKHRRPPIQPWWRPPGRR